MVTGAVACWYVRCSLCVIKSGTSRADRIDAMASALETESRFTVLDREMAQELCNVRSQQEDC